MDAIIVLGKGIGSEGTLTAIARRHVERGVALYSQAEAPNIVMTGAFGLFDPQPPRTEAAAMRAYALELGVPEGRIYMEEQSRDTIGNAFFTKETLLKPHGWHHLILVTADYTSCTFCRCHTEFNGSSPCAYDLIGHDDRLGAMIPHELEDLACNSRISPDVALFGEPTSQCTWLSPLFVQYRNCSFGRQRVIVAVERDCCDWIATKATAGFLLQG